VLVNNAGVPARGTFLKVAPEVIRRAIDVNYLGGVWCTRAFMPGLDAAAERDGRAHVVNLVSVAGTAAFMHAGGYAASKHAQLAFSRSLAAALRETPIRVHTIMPGFVETEGFPQHNVLRSRLLRRFLVEVDDVARAVVKAIERDKLEVTIPWFPYRLAAIAQTLTPALIVRFSGMTAYQPGSFQPGDPGGVPDP
jgi:short-subunit dehydrogenase